MLPARPSETWVDPALWPHPPRYHALPEGRLHHVDVGEGRPVLWVHGTPTWSIDWRHLIAGWAGRRHLTVDHLGFGRSDRPAAVGYRPEDHANRFAAFADALDLRDATVVLHDFGGPIGLPWVLDHLDRVERLVLVNTWAWPFEDRTMRLGAKVLGGPLGRWLYRWANLSLRVIAPSAWGDRSKLRPELQAQLLAPFEDRDARVEVLWALARSLLASESFYASLDRRLPALRDTRVDIVWGMKDPAFPPPVLARWRTSVPHARVLELPDAGHWPHEEAPDAVLGWLQGGS
ncbi:MAG: alpha/beta fold hydrolase [Alphaproteobacteria bacterium]|nr:alpha/beta fold hydrolase [Alphaproteobacteria bacterium]MCB9696001.1 alpha/beta fold hydrolase [Alphaproteobacteria bacterium]